MNNIKLHQWLAILFFAAFINACSKKITNTALNTEDKVTDTDTLYTPPAFIIVPDDKAKINKEDELYYDDQYGYRYWRYNDGKYYLDQKYIKTQIQKKKPAAVAKLTKTP